MIKRRILGFITLGLCLLVLASGCGGNPGNVTLTIGVEGDGTTVPTPGSHTYDKDTIVTLTATPNTGSVFSHWGGPDGASVTPENTILMDGDKTVTAVFMTAGTGISILTQPGDSVAGQAVTGYPTVQVMTDGSPAVGVTVAVAEKNGASFSGTSSRTTGSDGRAVFDDLVFDEGQYTLVFSTSGLSDAESDAFTVGLAGAGTEANPYLIHNLYGLDQIRNLSNGKYFRLENDIDASATGTPGSPYWNDGKGWDPVCDRDLFFFGEIDGNGHAISNLFINRPTEGSVGLIGGMAKFGLYTATIKNLSLVNADITGGLYTGGLLGYGESASVENCSVTGTVEGTNQFVGGLIGYFRSSTMSDCWSSAAVTGSSSSVGGLVGTVYGAADPAAISDCHATGNAQGDSLVGGLVGSASGTGTINIDRCYATGDATATSGSSGYAGGFLGNCQGVALTINDCYAWGTATGYSEVGGFGGYLSETTTLAHCYSAGDVTWTDSWALGHGGFMAGNSSATVTGCYYDSTVCGLSDTTCGSAPKTTAEMQDDATYDIGWNTSYWSIVDGAYPTLW